MSIATEKELLSAIMTAFPPVRKVLVIAPHPDDEVFGCGGTLSLLRDGGSAVTIVIATNGALGGNNADGKLAGIRAEESRAAAKILGLNIPVFWGLPDRGVNYGEVLIGQLIEIILEADADLVFLPSPADWHPDHQAIAFAGAEAIRRLGGKRQVAFFEVSDPLPCPNLIHDISSADEKKRQAMRCFHSQLREQPYDTRTSGINNFRAFHLGAQVKSAEAFTLLAAADLDKGLATLLDGPLAYRRNLGFAASGGDIPLVSVIIRSMDRPTLTDALDSLALQTYSNIEVVLVNAKGSEHREIEPWCGRFPVRMIGTGERLPRSRAANMGLDAARGEYLMFLDDDDWIEADHIQKLAAAIRRQPEFKVVYTGVKCVDEKKNPLDKKFDQPFDATQIVAGNFIPIHAAMFSRSLLELGGRLDEALDLYEDWDFWIQLSRHGDFLHVEGLSAVYRITQQSGFGVNADPALAVPARWAIYKKWLNRLGDHQITGLMEVARHNPIKDSQIASLHQAVGERDGQIVTLNQAVAERDGQITNLNQTVGERDEQITNLSQTVDERDGQITNLNQTVGERDEQITNLSQTVDERDEQITNLSQTVDERDEQIAAFIAERNHVFNSTSWKITKPLRFFRRSIMNKPCHFMRRIVSDSARQAWSGLPVSNRYKQLFKHKLFSNLPRLFRWSKAYRGWYAMNAPSDVKRVNLFAEQAPAVFSLTDNAYVPLLHVLPPKSIPARLIAFYLPQFHAIAENNAWWCEGFTEWTNVKPAQPQFEGHYQPCIPGELGYYDLLDPAVQRRQVELAKLYGVGGFCFYTYWFGGQILLEKPVENYLEDRSLNLPFCLCWANENWSRRWDGLDSEILIAQKHSPEDDLKFIRHIAQYMRDERYIRIDGKPLLLVYRPSLLPNARETAERWRHWCQRNGIGDIFLAYTQSFETVDPGEYGFDAAIEFPPSNSLPPNITEKVKPLSERFGCTVYDWKIFVKRSRNYQKPGYKLFRGVCPSWDNTARRKNRGTVFLNSSPQGYQEWLTNAVAETCTRIGNPEERLIFVNAWNEWAEGAYLEPDQHYGYAYLEATRRALLGESAGDAKKRIIIVSHDAHPHGAQFLALGMVRSLKQDMHMEVEVVLLGKGRLTSDFAALAPVHDLSDAGPDSEAITHLAKSLAQRGFTRALANTTVAGSVVPVFREAGIESVCLVHELPGVIQSHRLENQARQIAASARAVVFPAQIVADGFARFASVKQDRQFIRPQGLYRRNKWRLEKQVARVKLREQLGLSAATRIVLTVGYADHRKGVDLFVECALSILAKRVDIDFVWVGHWEQNMQKEVETKLLNSPHKNRLHFVGYNSDTALFHAASDVYALTSREDPFPNVVLESFDAGVPVVAFAGTGGAANLVEQVGGVVVPAQNVAEFSDAICRLLDTPGLSTRLGDAAQQHVDQHFAFRPYLFDLCAMLGINLPRVSVVVPNYNYAQYIEERLASIRNQSIPIFELIILDDASTDQSLQRISQWLSSTHTDAKVIINRTNSGNVFAQWRRGVALATGDYVWIAEADDLSDPDFLETVLPPLISEDTVLSYCESQQINSHGMVQAKNYHDYVSVVSQERWENAYMASGMEENKSSLAIMNTIPNVSAVVFNRDVINTVLNDHFDEIKQFKKAGDWVVYFRTLAHGNIAFSPRAANCHRRHDQSVIGESDRQSLLQEIMAVQENVAGMYRLSDDVQQKVQAYRRRLAAM